MFLFPDVGLALICVCTPYVCIFLTPSGVLLRLRPLSALGAATLMALYTETVMMSRLIFSGLLKGMKPIWIVGYVCVFNPDLCVSTTLRHVAPALQTCGHQLCPGFTVISKVSVSWPMAHLKRDGDGLGSQAILRSVSVVWRLPCTAS